MACLALSLSTFDMIIMKLSAWSFHRLSLRALGKMLIRIGGHLDWFDRVYTWNKSVGLF